MILTDDRIQYFAAMQSKVTHAMAAHHTRIPFLIEDDLPITSYLCIRQAWWQRESIRDVCRQHGISKSAYYEMEKRFVQHGLAGLFVLPKAPRQAPQLEQLVLLAKQARPVLSNQGILRLAQAVPVTEGHADEKLIGQILQCHGLRPSDQPSDRQFWTHLQRRFDNLERAHTQPLGNRSIQQRHQTYWQDDDRPLLRIELLRELFFDPQAQIKRACVRYTVAPATFYRLVDDYRYFGAWALIPAHSAGKAESISSETELAVVIEKLSHPSLSAQMLVVALKLKCSRFAVNRIFQRWGLTDRDRDPIALDHFATAKAAAVKQPLICARELIGEKQLLKTRRINRHFQLICDKMKHRSFHICDPGPLLLAPFIDSLGIAQAFESYGPERLRGKELTNLALLNVFRMIGGYRRVNHLNDNRDRSVAFAAGLGIFGSTSRFYEHSGQFKFAQLHSMRLDLVARARQLGLIQGKHVAIDFHFKDFYGAHSQDKNIGRGPSKSNGIHAGFRPHVAWDLAANTIINMSYYDGGVRASSIVEQFCEAHIFSVLDPAAIAEIYMDSEYTKERTLSYFKQERCRNGDVYLCLKQNKQVKLLIAPALAEADGWEPIANDDECKRIEVTLPHCQLTLVVVILRQRHSGKHVRCFGSTQRRVSQHELLEKYRYRWGIENGLKDLVHSYFLDEVYGYDPEKIEFEFYCVMVARLAYEYFLRTLRSGHFEKPDGTKTTLATMRCLLLEKRNCTLSQDGEGNIIVTLLDSSANALERRACAMYEQMKADGTNKVLWWKNRSVLLRLNDQFADVSS